MNPMHPILSRTLLFAAMMGLSLAPASCGGGGSDATGGTAGLGILLTDAPTDGLSVVEMDLLSIQLRRADGSFSANLLPARRTYDLLALAGTRSLLALVDPPPGSYDGVRVEIDPASVRIFDATGAAVSVRVLRSSDLASFSTRGEGTMLIGSGFSNLLVDVDLSKSLAEDLAQPGGKTFELEVEAEHEFEHEGMDEFRGRVTREDPNAGSFTMDLLDDSGVRFGSVTVLVHEGDLLLDDNDLLFANRAAFFAALNFGSEVEVHGSVTSAGRVDADRVEIEDAFSYPIKLKGDVLSVDSGAQEFDFLLKEVRRGSQTVYATLAQLGNPRILRMSWSGDTNFRVEDGGSSSAAALVPGAELYLGFLNFTPPMPFPVASVELDGEGAEYEGSITDVSGLPASFTLAVDHDQPSWLSGAISGPVQVNLNAVDRIYLDTETNPALAVSTLLAGLKCEIHGDLSGPPQAATLVARTVKIKPGRLVGEVTGLNLGARTLTVQLTDLKDPFGGPSLNGSVTVQVPVAAWIEGKSGPLTLAQVASLLAGLGVGEVLELELEGLGDGSGGVTGWELELEVRD